MAAQMNQLLIVEKHPELLTEGPIKLQTCLSTTWKLPSGIIVAKMNKHMAKYMSGEQKRIGRNTRGAKHQLLTTRPPVI